jgi:hypothetical protein
VGPFSEIEHLPSIQLFRNNYPNAKIAFGESPSSRALCANLPIDKHYPVWKVPRIILGLSGISRFHAGMELLNRAEIASPHYSRFLKFW